MNRLKEEILNDWKAYGSCFDNMSRFKFFITHGGAQISCCYRIYKACVFKKRRILSFLFRIVYNHLCVKYGCDIPSKVNIGAGLCLPHPNGVVINSGVSIGKNVTILGGTVLGHTEKGIPTVEDGAYIGANACIIGNVVIGHDSIIGAGSVVTKDVLAYQVVAGNPARVLRVNTPE